MAKVQVFQRTDGGISIRRPGYQHKNPGETDEQFIERTSVKPRTYPNLQGAKEFIMEESDLPPAVTVGDKKNRNKWRLSPNKKRVIVDPTIELPEEADQKKRNSIRGKLTAGQPLSADEADFLTKRL